MKMKDKIDENHLQNIGIMLIVLIVLVIFTILSFVLVPDTQELFIEVLVQIQTLTYIILVYFGKICFLLVFILQDTISDDMYAVIGIIDFIILSVFIKMGVYQKGELFNFLNVNKNSLDWIDIDIIFVKKKIKVICPFLLLYLREKGLFS